MADVVEGVNAFAVAIAGELKGRGWEICFAWAAEAADLGSLGKEPVTLQLRVQAPDVVR